MIIFKEVATLEIGACGANGAMGAVLTDYKDKLGEGGLNFEGQLPQPIDEKLDGSDVPLVSIAGPRSGHYVTGTLKKFTVDDIAVFEGGTVTTGVYSAPTTRQTIYKSVKITGKDVGGEYTELNMPKCAVMGMRFGNPNSDAAGIYGLAFGIKEILPVDASGDPLPPHTIESKASA